MPNIITPSASCSAVPKFSQRHLEGLLALSGGKAFAEGALNEIADEIVALSLAAFDLTVAQIWRRDENWRCLIEARRCKTDAIAYPAPNEKPSPDLAACITDCYVMTPGGLPVALLRLIKPEGMVWSEEERAITASYANILENALTMAQLRQKIENLDGAKLSAEEANRSKTEFMANMSHELRTPLNAIIGFSEILAQEYFGVHANPQYKDYAHDILHSGQHLLSLINDILDLSRIESGKQHLQEEVVKLDELIQAAARLLRERLGAKAQKFVLEGDNNVTLFAEARAIKQILVNLLSNAIKFTPQNGTITLAVSVGECVQISVRDTGRGIDSHMLQQLFQPFNRGQENGTPTEEGAGLGLVISQKLARLHGGDLILQSEVGIGTIAILSLPLQRLVSDVAGLVPWDIQS